MVTRSGLWVVVEAPVKFGHACMVAIQGGSRLVYQPFVSQEHHHANGHDIIPVIGSSCLVHCFEDL